MSENLLTLRPAFFLPLLAALTVAIGTVPRQALADPSGAPAKSLSEIREMEQSVEARHGQKMREIQDALTIQSYDSDTALMLRMKADQEYKANMQQLRLDEQAAYNALDAKQRPAGDASSRAPTSAAIPRFQSQSVITYPQGDNGPATPEKPRREGEQKNVGFGTRELQF